jgi:N-acetylmuramoyl-L-alanine amidase
MRLFLSLTLPLFLAACSSTGPSSPSTASIPASWGGLEIQRDFIPKGHHGRHRILRMNPRYITIHSTQNFASSADARAHARMLRTGALKGSKNSLGYITWHFTVDEDSIWQSLPTNEQGQHADYEGEGNRKSIGIEMCENRGNSRAATMDRTAKLTAVLMKRHGIPLRNVVPHGHWRMIRYADGRDLGHKNCPHYLLENGKRGAKWNAFIAQINRYHRQL